MYTSFLHTIKAGVMRPTKIQNKRVFLDVYRKRNISANDGEIWQISSG